MPRTPKRARDDAWRAGDFVESEPVTGGSPPRCPPVSRAFFLEASGSGKGDQGAQQAIDRFEADRERKLRQCERAAAAWAKTATCPDGCERNGSQVTGPAQGLPRVEVDIHATPVTYRISMDVGYWAVVFCK